MIEVGVAVVHRIQARPHPLAVGSRAVVEDGADGWLHRLDVWRRLRRRLRRVVRRTSATSRATVDLLADLAGASSAHLPVLELGVGTGRLAIPLAARRASMSSALDSSAAMLAKLAGNDRDAVGDVRLRRHGRRPAGRPVRRSCSSPTTPSSICSPRARQQACFDAVAERLAPGGAFVIEAFVPEPQPGVVGRCAIDDRRLGRAQRHDARRRDADRAGSVHLVQRVGRRAHAAVGDPLRDRRSNSTRWRQRLDFVSISDGKTPTARRSPPTAHVTCRVYRTIHSPVRPQRVATS